MFKVAKLTGVALAMALLLCASSGPVGGQSASETAESIKQKASEATTAVKNEASPPATIGDKIKESFSKAGAQLQGYADQLAAQIPKRLRRQVSASQQDNDHHHHHHNHHHEHNLPAGSSGQHEHSEESHSSRHHEPAGQSRPSQFDERLDSARQLVQKIRERCLSGLEQHDSRRPSTTSIDSYSSQSSSRLRREEERSGDALGKLGELGDKVRNRTTDARQLVQNIRTKCAEILGNQQDGRRQQQQHQAHEHPAQRLRRQAIVVVPEGQQSGYGAPIPQAVFGTVPQQQSIFGTVPQQQSVFGAVPQEQSVVGAVPQQQAYAATIPQQQTVAVAGPQRQEVIATAASPQQQAPTIGFVRVRRQVVVVVPERQEKQKKVVATIPQQQAYGATVPQQQTVIKTVPQQQSVVATVPQQRAVVAPQRPVIAATVPQTNIPQVVGQRIQRQTIPAQQQAAAAPAAQQQAPATGGNFLQSNGQQAVAALAALGEQVREQTQAAAGAAVQQFQSVRDQLVAGADRQVPKRVRRQIQYPQLEQSGQTAGAAPQPSSGSGGVMKYISDLGQQAQQAQAISQFLQAAGASGSGQGQTAGSAAGQSAAGQSVAQVLTQLTDLIKATQNRNARLMESSQRSLEETNKQTMDAAKNAQGGLQAALSDMMQGLQRLAANNPNLVPDIKSLYQSVSSRLNTQTGQAQAAAAANGLNQVTPPTPSGATI